MNDFENLVRVEILRYYVSHGRAPVPAELSTLVDAPAAEVESALRTLADEHVLVLAPGSPYILMTNPFSAVPTDFRVHADGREWWANCIWDAFGILGLIGSDGTISTHCPDCSQPLSVKLEGSRVDRDDLLVHFAVPARQWWDDIGYT